MLKKYVIWSLKYFLILNINHFKVEFLQEQLMLTAKPVTVIINMSEKDFIRQNNKWLKPIFAWVNEHSPGTSPSELF